MQNSLAWTHSADSRDLVENLTADAEEDVYVRLEGAAYLAAAGTRSARELYTPFLTHTDQQTQLEAVISLAEIDNADSVLLLADLLADLAKPYFLRSAAAWALGRSRQTVAAEALTRAFGDVDHNIREEALDAIVALGRLAIPLLLPHLRLNNEVAAGAAEALRQQSNLLSVDELTQLARTVEATPMSIWTVWLLGHVSRDRAVAAIAGVQDIAPAVHYALSVLWSFCESWIAKRWELTPAAIFPVETAHDVEPTA